MKEVFKKVTRQLVEQLQEIEEGKRPAQWFKPWTAGQLPQFPENFTTGANYKGINAFLLYMASMDAGYRTNRWMTFKQKNTVNENQGMELKIRKGEHGYPIFKYVEWIGKQFEERSGEGGGFVNTRNGEIVDKDMATMRTLRQYTVFNLDQMENVPDGYIPVPEIDWDQRYKDALEFAENLPGKVIHKDGDKAYYYPAAHHIVMPLPQQFKSQEDYLATLFHEHVHWTAKLVDRDTKDYSKEELVAEIGSAFLCAHHGLSAPLQHPQYIKNYIERLQESDRAFWNAANRAQEAVNYLLKEGKHHA